MFVVACCVWCVLALFRSCVMLRFDLFHVIPLLLCHVCGVSCCVWVCPVSCVVCVLALLFVVLYLMCHFCLERFKLLGLFHVMCFSLF